MKKILVPTDFTQGSLNAYEYALKLAHQIGGKVILYHVYSGSNDGGGHMPKSLAEALQKQEEEAALSAFEGYGYSVQHGLNIEVPSTYILEKGVPVDAITAYADFMEVDLIVMGTWWSKGASGVVDTWLGNVGTKVVDRTSRPVLLIPDRVSYKSIQHIAYATNLKEGEQRIPTELKHFIHGKETQLSCVHVRRPLATFDPIQYSFMQEFYKLELDDFNIQFFIIPHEDIMEGLDLFIKEKDADMLVMLAHERLTVFNRILGPDLSRQMAFHSKIPLLVLHEEYVSN